MLLTFYLFNLNYKKFKQVGSMLKIICKDLQQNRRHFIGGCSALLHMVGCYPKKLKLKRDGMR